MKKEAISRLESFGVRPSLQRIAIMDYMLNNRCHPTADQVYVALLDQMPTLSKMTVYNTLTLLSERGAVLSLSVDARQKRFDGDTSLHGHFICQCCGEVEDVFYTPSQCEALLATFPCSISETTALQTHSSTASLSQIMRMEVSYTGLCHICASSLHSTTNTRKS